MIKVIVTGAESTGKSTLASSLARHYKAPLVEEYARTYLSHLHRPYDYGDLLTIAKGQLKAEHKASIQQPPLLICDTSLLVIKIWSEYKYGTLDDWIDQQFSKQVCDLYILPHYDIPYEADPLRENPLSRHILYQIYLDTLKYHDLPHMIVTGSPSARVQQAQAKIDSLTITKT